MDELGLKLAELAEEAAGGARPAGAAAARRRGARRRRRQAMGALVLIAGLVAGLVWVDQRPPPTTNATKGWKTLPTWPAISSSATRPAGQSIVPPRVVTRSCCCHPRTPTGHLTRCGTW
jgi:hypothetical protein